jgi:hypothetical protein
MKETTMSKTKKSLALIAGLSLTASGLMALPASAANEITLAVSSGTGNTTILGETFQLSATVSSALTSTAYPDVTFQVTNSANASLTYGMDNTSGTTIADTTGVTTDGISATTSSGTSDYVKDSTVSPTKNQAFSVTSAATVGHSVEVVAWIDDNQDGVIDSAEFRSPAVTVSFVTVANAGLSAAYSTVPQVGDATMASSITSSVINVAQVDVAHFGVQFATYASGSAVSNVAVVVWLTTQGTLADRGSAVTLESVSKVSLDTGPITLLAAAAASTSYGMRAVYALTPNSGVWTVLGTADTRALGAVTANSGESSVTITADSNVTSAGIVRKSYKGNVVYTVKVLDVDKVAVTGKTVRLTTTSGTNASGTIKLNGVAVSESATQTHDVVTDAAGIATFTATNDQGSVSDTLAVTTITVEGVTITGNASDLDWDAATYASTDIAAVNSADVTRSATTGSALTLQVKALDQWKQALTASDVRVKATASGRTTAVYTDTLANGVATLTIADGANSSGDTTVVFTTEELNSAVWGSKVDYAGILTDLSNYTVKYYASTVVESVTIAVNNGTTSDLAAAQTRVTTSAWNTNLDNNLVRTYDVGATPGTTLDDETATISGTVVDSSTLVPKDGAMITISGSSDILFVVGGVASFGSLSFYDADGAYSVNAYSNKTATNSVVTVTSGSASKTAKVSFAAGETNVGTTLAFTGSTSANAGGVVQVVATLTDKFGNAVDTAITASDWNGDADTTDVGETSAEFTMTVTGPGLSIVASPTATDANGQATISRLLGSSDTTGTLTYTATYGGDDGVIGTGLDDITAIYTVTIGEVAVAASDTKVNVGTFKGYVALYAKGYEGQKMSAIVAGKWIVVESLASDFERVVRFTGAGYTITTKIYIDGVQVGDAFTTVTK